MGDGALKTETRYQALLEQLKQKEAKIRSLVREMEARRIETDAAIEKANALAVEAHLAGLELKQIFNTLADPTWVIDREFTVRRVNDAFLRLLGKKSSEVVGRKCYEMFRSRLCGSEDCPMKLAAGKGNRAEYEIEKKLSGGKTVPFILAATPFSVMDEKRIGILEAYKDISERKESEEALRTLNRELETLASVDGLTQVANRRSFEENLKKEWMRLKRTQSPLSVIILDVDFFKLYNDTYGHQSGDECLKAVAWFINLQARRSSDLVARYGGEEFAILLPDTSLEGAVGIAERIRTEIGALQLQHAASPAGPSVTVSMGVSSLVPGPDTTPERLVELADRALYEAKQSGRNQVRERKG